jgi:molybdopterin biosynthesis enzyme
MTNRNEATSESTLFKKNPSLFWTSKIYNSNSNIHHNYINSNRSEINSRLQTFDEELWVRDLERNWSQPDVVITFDGYLMSSDLNIALATFNMIEVSNTSYFLLIIYF